jgi:hypothetical protein
VTHDELLAKLSNDENGYAGSSPLQRLYALRAVAELHKPMEENCECDREHVPTCEECVDDYPCSTIQAIEKELE